MCESVNKRSLKDNVKFNANVLNSQILKSKKTFKFKSITHKKRRLNLDINKNAHIINQNNNFTFLKLYNYTYDLIFTINALKRIYHFSKKSKIRQKSTYP